MPSYFGSKVQPVPGTSLPTLAYIGSRTPALAPAALGSELSSFLRRAIGARGNFFDAVALGSRLLCQTLLLPPAISSIVRPVSTDVMFSATTSSSVAYSSRCLIMSHCGLDEDDPSREYFIRMSANEPCSRSPWKVILRSPRLRPSRIASASASAEEATSEV